MVQMVRKQIHIARHQQMLLARMAAARGVSEAEIIRRAIDREAMGEATQSVASDATALDEIIQFALSRRQQETAGAAYKWSREDAYSERLNRYASRITGSDD
jgi:hypothetical protein